VTTEQLIVLGFIAAAFLAGWLAHVVTAWAGRSRARAKVASVLSAPAARFEDAAHESRQELDRTIRAYNAAVGLSLKDDDSQADAGKGALEILAHALYALALAIGHASDEVEQGHPLAAELRESGAELRRLAQDVMLYTSEPEVPNGVLDQLEQQLMSAASALLPRSESQVVA
jgi:hypothetical protein